MITGIKKTHKTTEIYFDEADKWTTVITYNTSLKNRLLTFSQKHPELCEMFSDDECGCLSFRIDKKCFTYRLVEPYSNERKAKAREKMQELNAKMQLSPVTPSHHSKSASEETKKSPARGGARIIYYNRNF